MTSNAAPTVPATATSRDAPRLRRPRAAWSLYVALALLLGAYQGLNQLVGLDDMGAMGHSTWEPFVWEISSVVVWMGLVALLVIPLEARFRVDSKPRGRVVLAHAAGVLVFSAAHTTGMVALRKLAYAVAGDSYSFGNVWVESFYELQKDVLLYAGILTVVFAAREFRVRRAGELRAAELAAELGEARLRQLTAQIEPHFLFNSLNAISNRMREDVEAADRMITQLGNLLRAAYESGDDVLVPLGRELAWLHDYTAMMGERFRGSMTYEIEVEPGLENERVPRLLLQPIVENALKHGLDAGSGWLRVAVARRGERLEYTVSDDGAGLSAQAPARGTGLSNVARRLELLFPNQHTFTIAARSPRGVVVTISFPTAA